MLAYEERSFAACKSVLTATLLDAELTRIFGQSICQWASSL